MTISPSTDLFPLLPRDNGPCRGTGASRRDEDTDTFTFRHTAAIFRRPRPLPALLDWLNRGTGLAQTQDGTGEVGGAGLGGAGRSERSGGWAGGRGGAGEAGGRGIRVSADCCSHLSRGLGCVVRSSLKELCHLGKNPRAAAQYHTLHRAL